MDARDNTRFVTFSRRAALLSVGTVGLFGGLVARLVQLQVNERELYTKAAEENRVNIRLLAPLRGKLLDRFGIELATNRQNFRAVIVPEQTAGDPEGVLSRLVTFVPRLQSERDRVLKEIAHGRAFMPVVIAENLTWEEFAVVNFHAPELPGIVPDVGSTRDYPFGHQLSHVLGYVSRVAENDMEDDPLLRLPGFRIGKNGIEKTIDKQLRGRPGQSHVEVNAYGRVIRELKHQEGDPGDDAVLTLDMDIQSFAAERMKDESGSCIVIDITNGDVLALMSAPGFDPNFFNTGISRAQWKALNDDPYHPLINKAISGTYPPGSTFKLVTALAALHYKVCDPDDDYVHCSAEMWLGNHAFHCWKKEGHGSMNFHAGIKNSCDIYFYEMARRLGVDRIADVARKLGLGQDFGIEVPNAKTGIVPSSGWKLATTGVGWQLGETLITGIGQGYLLTTPLQLALMTARLVTGKQIKPHVIRSVGPQSREPDDIEPLNFDPSHIARVMDGMNGVSNEPGGTAYGSRIADLGPLTLAGKTGSAQVRRITMAERATGVIKNENLPWEQRDHALFVCFAPVIKPRYAMCVVIEHGGSGSHAAAPIARDIMREVLIRDPASKKPLAPIARAEQRNQVG
jgi:penicillin-binding protein 2